MPEQPYHQSCPGCGSALAPNAGGAEIPPWRCDECRRSWYVAELTTEARKSYRPEQRDFGSPGSPSDRAVRDAVLHECHAAAARGTSVRQDQLGLVAPETVEALVGAFPIPDAFAGTMRAAH